MSNDLNFCACKHFWRHIVVEIVFFDLVLGPACPRSSLLVTCRPSYVHVIPGRPRSSEVVPRLPTALRHGCFGADDDQGNSVVHMILGVVTGTGKQGLSANVEKLIRITQNNDRAVAMGLAASLILEGVILGQSGYVAVEAAAAQLENSSRSRQLMCSIFGAPWKMPKSLPVHYCPDL